MKQTRDARVRCLAVALLPGVAVAALLLTPAGCASSEKSDGANAAQLPQDNSLSPEDQQLRDVQRQRAAQRPNVR